MERERKMESVGVWAEREIWETRDEQYIKDCFCVCVCVCVREREREREMIRKYEIRSIGKDFWNLLLIKSAMKRG